MPRKPKSGPWEAGGNRVANRPQLAIKIAVTANTWTSIEGHMAYALGAIIGTDHRVALAILSKVQTATAKSQMIRAVGTAALDTRIQPELDKLLKTFDALAKRRNKVVHGLWGTMDVEPDGLLWVPPDAPSRISLGLVAAMQAGNPMEMIRDILADAELWDASDFDKLNSDLDELLGMSVQFAAKMQSLTMAKSHGIDIGQIIDSYRQD